MTISDLLEHFGGQNEVAKALGLDRRTVWAWVNRGRIPAARQFEIEYATGGALQADRRHFGAVEAVA